MTSNSPERLPSKQSWPSFVQFREENHNRASKSMNGILLRWAVLGMERRGKNWAFRNIIVFIEIHSWQPVINNNYILTLTFDMRACTTATVEFEINYKNAKVLFTLWVW